MRVGYRDSFGGEGGPHQAELRCAGCAPQHGLPSFSFKPRAAADSENVGLKAHVLSACEARDTEGHVPHQQLALSDCSDVLRGFIL